MGTINLLLTRIDNRLVHGQVGVSWVNTLGANLVVVANDEVAEDEVQQHLMEMVLPDTVEIRFFSIEKTIRVINKAAPHQKILLVIKTPQDALNLVKGGVPIKDINVGNLHFSEGKKQIAPTISVDEADVKVFKELEQLGIGLEVKGVPNERGTQLMPLLQNF